MSTTHWSEVKDECSSSVILGSATFTMETSTSSMNAPRHTVTRGVHFHAWRWFASACVPTWSVTSLRFCVVMAVILCALTPSMTARYGIAADSDTRGSGTVKSRTFAASPWLEFDLLRRVLNDAAAGPADGGSTTLHAAL